MPSKPLNISPEISGYRMTGKEALLVQAQRYRCEADRLETLARELGDLSCQADEALWQLIHSPRTVLRS